MLDHRRSRWPLAALLLTLAATPAVAQPPGSRVAGVVRDAQGRPIASVVVAARNEATGETRRATTGGAGAYSVTGLSAGTYTVSASLIGYRRAQRVGVTVPADGVDLTLEVLPLQSVVVTATLREQELTDVPFSIAAPTATLLRQRGAETIEQVAQNVAGFSVQNLGPGQSQPAIRGASSGQVARDQPGVKEDVGAYLDDSPISLSLFTPDLDLFDVSRVEVLRGPQGTLFGAGSLSGTVRYITNQPELGVRSAFGELGASYAQRGNAGGTVKLGGNMPFGERAAGRIAGYVNQIPGFMEAVQPGLAVRDAVNDGRRAGVRAALRVDPTARLSLVPRIVYQDVSMNGWNRIDAFNILANPYTTSRPAVTLGERQQFTQIDEPFADKFTLGDLRATLDFGRATLTSVSMFTHRDIDVVRDATALTASITGGSLNLPASVYTIGAPLDDRTKSDVFTQELRLSGGTGGRAKWLVGAFYTQNDRKYSQRLTVSGFSATSGIASRGIRAQTDELYWSDLAYDLSQTALFGEATVSLTDRIDVTGGLRWYRFDETRDQVFDGIFSDADVGKSVLSVPGTTKSDGLAPRGIVSFRVSDALTLNAQAARGFRLGGINDPLNVPLCSAADLQTFQGRGSWTDQKVWNYEVGAKSRFGGGKVSFDVSAYDMQIDDLQLTLTAGTCSSRLVFNVPKAVSRGAEAELAIAPNEFVDLAFSGALADAELRSTVTSTAANGTTSVISGLRSGNRLPSVPRVQASAAVTLRRPLPRGVSGFVTGSWTYVGDRYTQIDDLTPGIGTVALNTFPGTIGGPLRQNTFTFDPLLPAYNLVNLRVGVSRGIWDAALYVNNVTDERALLALDRERGLRARVGYLTNPTRTIGVTTSFRR
jgi:iron complex outermembrane recepter protein